MTTAVAEIKNRALADRRDLTAEQVDLIKRTICRGAMDDELTLFIGQCNRTGLDPFSRQIHAVKRWNAKAQREEMSIQVGVDGFRLVAERTGKTDGQEGPYWCGHDGKWVDVWLSEEMPAAAKVIVYRKGESHPYVGVARLGAYLQTTKDGTPNAFWKRMPDVMLAKCAECLALRKAFPQELSGLYSPEEMRDLDDIITPENGRPAMDPASQQAPKPQSNGPSKNGNNYEPPPSQQPNAEQRRAERVLRALHSVGGSWQDAKYRNRIAEKIGRPIPEGAPASSLTDSEISLLEAYCDEYLKEKARKKAGKEAPANQPATTVKTDDTKFSAEHCRDFAKVINETGWTWPSLRGQFPELLSCKPDDVPTIADLMIREFQILVDFMKQHPKKR